jgi:hypothetical protein
VLNKPDIDLPQALVTNPGVWFRAARTVTRIARKILAPAATGPGTGERTGIDMTEG